MPVFAYSGRTRTGRIVGGERMADSREAAVAALRREDVLVTRIAPASGEAAPRAEPAPRRSAPPKNLAAFTRQLAVMVGAGLPLVQCLDILGRQEPHRRFATTILKVRDDVEGGAALADALRKHPRTFDALYSNMIVAGEAGGILETILDRLALHIETSVRIKGRVRSAMAYPVSVIGIAVLVVAAILWKVIPTFASLFQGLGAELPAPTRLVIAASEVVVSYGGMFLLAAAMGAIGIRKSYRTPRGRLALDSVLLKLPVLGPILRKAAVARFCRTLSTLLGSGVPILQALDITARGAGNAVIARAVSFARTRIERGATIAAPLRETNVFPPMAVQMIGVGETTGALDNMLERIADFYEEEVDAAVAGLLTLMEPVMVAFLGVVVGGIVIAMYLPIFDLIGKVS